VGAGDDGHEAYTAIMWSGILSRERDNPAEAEVVTKAEGNTLRTAMRGATTLPWSETPLRYEGNATEPGRPHLAQTAMAGLGRDGKPKRRSRRGRGPSAGARCRKAARRDLRGGAGVTRSPTATTSGVEFLDGVHYVAAAIAWSSFAGRKPG
jgi:hypothetical protein